PQELIHFDWLSMPTESNGWQKILIIKYDMSGFVQLWSSKKGDAAATINGLHHVTRLNDAVRKFWCLYRQKLWERTYSLYSTNPLDSLIRQVMYLYAELQLLMDNTGYGNSLYVSGPTFRPCRIQANPAASCIHTTWGQQWPTSQRAPPTQQSSVSSWNLDASSMLASLAATTKTFVDKNCPWRTEPYPFVSVQFTDDKLDHSWTNRVVALATTYTWDGKTAKVVFWNKSPLRAAKAAKIITLDSGDDDENDADDPDCSKNDALSDQLDTVIDAELQDTDE
ncbi:hypothetical protein DYB26_001382, partial [Aphanomyces astaci]